MFKIRGETVVRWEAVVTEESGELNAEDATAKACDEARDCIGGGAIYAAPGVALETSHHYTAASGCESLEERRGEDHRGLEGTPRHEDGAGRDALARTPGGRSGLARTQEGAPGAGERARGETE